METSSRTLAVSLQASKSETMSLTSTISFLDALFLALDACFRLKRRNISSHTADPGLSHGFSYFVEETKLTDHLSNYENEVELVISHYESPISLFLNCFSQKSTCSRHEAVNLSESKRGQGHASTGVAAVVCSRHDMKRPNGVAQLQRGERYAFAFFITINVISYLILLLDTVIWITSSTSLLRSRRFTT